MQSSDSLPKAQLRVQYHEDQDIHAPSYEVHGRYRLPPGYSLQVLPGHINVKTGSGLPPVNIASSSSATKAFVAVVQIVFASLTLYRSRGDQLERYGYAAFSLTVIPYAVMSLVNLTTGLLMPQYPMKYIVRSDVLDEAVSRGGYFDGTVGELETDPAAARNGGKFQILIHKDNGGKLVASNAEYPSTSWKLVDGPGAGASAIQNPDYLPPQPEPHAVEYNPYHAYDPYPTTYSYPSTDQSHQTPEVILIPAIGNYTARKDNFFDHFWTILFAVVWIGTVVAPFLIIWALTGFDAKKSSFAQRFWIMSWLVVGQLAVVGIGFGSWSMRDKARKAKKPLPRVGYFLGLLAWVGVFSVPTVGGFVVVAKMIKEYGWCVYL